MAAPTIFISSTYYDLKHLRSALEAFITGMDYEPVLSEKGDIAYSPDVPLDESCYRAATQADIFVLIIGGRYGSAASSEEHGKNKKFFERYDSITKKEYQSALAEGVPSYILVEREVYAEYQTFRRNRDRNDLNYAHVDSVNIFHLIDEILAQRRGNPIFEFERYEEIESWLRLQWAGLFKDLLGRLTQQEQLSSLSSQVSQLAESNITLRRYLETVVSSVSPDSSASLIDEESRRLEQSIVDHKLSQNDFVKFVLKSEKANLPQVRQALVKAKSVDMMCASIQKYLDGSDSEWLTRELPNRPDYIKRDINWARKSLQLPALNWTTRKRSSKSKSTRD